MDRPNPAPSVSPDAPHEPRHHPPLPVGKAVLVGVLLALPVLALMWVSSYARETPRLWGFPFFYWYQFLWVFAAAVCTSLAYRLVAGRDDRAPRGPRTRR